MGKEAIVHSGHEGAVRFTIFAPHGKTLISLDETDAILIWDPTTGRILRVLTTQPAVQLYTGNHLDGSITGKQGIVYKPRFALCLETQHFPDSPNHTSFPSTELKPGQKFHSVTVFQLSAGTR